MDDFTSGTDDGGKQNLLIWHSKSTPQTSDDLLLMVIEDFAYDDLTYAMLDVVAKDTSALIIDVDENTAQPTRTSLANLILPFGTTADIVSVNGEAYDPANAIFRMTGNALQLNANIALDHDTTPHYELRIKLTAQ